MKVLESGVKVVMLKQNFWSQVKTVGRQVKLNTDPDVNLNVGARN